ncbi:MAG: response regulator [Candidatus Hermodarchaeota archaeon]
MENKNHKILFVEDERVDQIAFERFVQREQLPYNYIIAGSVSEATKILSSEQFDIVITDYFLGDGTAFEFFELIKDTPIVVITAMGDADTAVKAMKSGAYDYLIKDVESDHLKILPLTIDNAIKHKSTEKELSILSELHKTVLENTFDSIAVTNFEGNILFANKALAELSRYSEEHLKDLHLSEITVSPQFVSHIIESAKNSNAFRNLETTLVPKNGPEVPIALSMSPIENYKQILIVIRDLRAEKERSEEIEFFRKFSVENMYTSLFKVRETHIEPVISDNLPFIKDSDKEFLIRVGNYYASALGRGKKDNIGLFGPLPVPDFPDFLGLIYSFFMNDPLNKNPRNKGKSYCFIVLSIPKSFVRLFSNRTSITNIFDKRLEMLANIYEIDLVFLNSLKYQILDASMSSG